MNLPHHVFTSQEIRYIEQQHACEHDGHCYDLMEKAGRAVFEEMLKVNENPNMVYVIVGKGNNGGDGYIVASKLLKHHIPFRLFAIGEPHEDSEAHTARSFFEQIGGQVENSLPNLYEESRKGNSPDIVIDALLGTGLNSTPKDPYNDWIDFINSTKAFVISIDIPSGLNADTGKVYTDCVVANKTICMMGLKAGLLTGDAVDYVGDIEVYNLGVDVNSYHGSLKSYDLEGASYLPIYVTCYEDIISDLPVRTPSSNKGDAGKVLLIGGALGFAGAISICGQAALRTGAGLVKIATDKENVAAINAIRPELMTIDFSNKDAISNNIDWADVLAIGPGLGTDQNAEQLIDLVLNSEKSAVIDADALNVIARLGPIYSRRTIITPHPGEAARLLDSTIEEVNSDRFAAVYELQRKCGGVVLLKGAGTLVCDGKKIVIIREGSAAMASGGMGDLLTGIIASLKAQGLTLMDATVAAACIHGRAGQLCGEEYGMVGTLALDLLPYVRFLVNKRPGLASPSGIEVKSTSTIPVNTTLFLT